MFFYLFFVPHASLTKQYDKTEQVGDGERERERESLMAQA